MAHKLTNFTRGSQLIGHFGFMFAAGLKGPAIVTALVFAGAIWWQVDTDLSDHERYLCWMRLYAGLYNWFEFDPAKLVNLKFASGAQLTLPMASAPHHPIIAYAWAKLVSAAAAGATLAAIVAVPATAAFAWVATRFGRRSKESRHERGATLASLPALVAEIDAHNGGERAGEYRRLLGAGWRLSSPSERREACLYEPYRLAGVPFPWRLEQSHAMLIGTTGTGKTVALRDLLSQVRARGHRAVIFDLTGAFIEAFFDPERDVILNPLDARCPQWSVFEDCPDEASFTTAAEALVPHDGGGSEQFWVLAARMLFVEMCMKLVAEGRATNAALSTELMTASLAHVHKLMEGTVADPLTAPEAARMAESIRAVFNANAKALRMLPSTGPLFSVRNWVMGGGAPGGFLFVSARYVDMSVASRLLTVWMDTAMNTLMAGPRSADLKLWFLVDELGALHRLPALEKGLQTARNYGGAIITGVHAYAKLKETYGDNMAMTLAALARTKLVLATADRESATWCSDFIGHRQFREMEEGYSYGYNNARDAVSLTPRRQIEPLLLPDQLMNLPRLQGYIKFPDGFPAAPIRLTYSAYPSIAEPFVARVSMPPKPAPGEDPAGGGNGTATVSASGTDQGPGPNSEGGQANRRAVTGTHSQSPVVDRPPLDQRPATDRTGGTERGIGQADKPERPTSGREPVFSVKPAPPKPPTLPVASRPVAEGESADAAKSSGTSERVGDGRPGTVNPARAVRPLSPGEHISLRELKAGIGSAERGERLDAGLDLDFEP